MTKYFFCLLLLLSMTFLSCDKTTKINIPLLTLEDIQGEWLEIESIISAYGGSNHHFMVEGEDAYLTLIRSTDIIEQGAICPGNRTDFAIGTIAFEEDRFIFTGLYSDEDFTETIPNCKEESTYDLNFNYTYEDGVLILNPEAPEQQQIRLEKQD